ncbi:hypothetical protein KL942_000701 [Ogataea angusta]|uniref:PABS domain-containing protein n=1 Tax=Pichia angusta TaxID=870730 RepID=A0AAN6DJZ4_PICAN|nr:uncharacterized protein KL928_000307 [Ogataea angusta]KAG7821832.1 hypothetical protein KL928_000307 [Ogataea angusta]KAG7831179.1 hypothetical protein KL920_000699 [Ogataea angusta]KAG7841963.1 hypothetical protein KL942_000701 [Ogataea angusta]KAG7852242.1 hypothetical protein KL940_001124 [Ogataea angusta]KAG7853254.1 hypothetical protein KL941_000304 [Ogataea angusta]
MPLTHPLIKDGWFREESDESFPGQAMRLRVAEILHAEKSKFQDVLVFRSTDFGNVLVLDGIIQVTERDEFAYQEMITHVPLFAHPCPKKVLVIGGGDGGVLREVLKHDCVERATLVEIDESVISLSKKYLPNMAKSLSHEKVQVVLADGFEYLKNTAAKDEADKYDVIVTDSSDPDGPAEAFFQKQYFELLYNALNANGMVISMASENIWLNIDKLKSLKDICSQVFAQNRADLGDKTHQRKAKSQVLAQLHHRVESVVARRQNALQQIINHSLELLFFSLHQLRRLRGAERARLEFGEMQSRELKRGQLSLARDLVDVDAQLQHRAQAPVQNVEVLPPQRRPVLVRVPVVHQVRDLVLVQQRRLHPG